jgi:outer membrane protein assembly factor BamB
MASAAVLLLIAVVRVGAMKQVHFDGDMGTPTVTWRWQSTPFEGVSWDRADPRDAKPIVVDAVVTDGDFPEYRGKNRDGVVVGPKLSRDWSKPPRTLWKQPCGEGYSGFAVAGNLAVTMEQRSNNEVIVAYHSDSGREVWRHGYRARFAESLGGDGPRATPTIHDGRVYSVGATGQFTCNDLVSGKVLWSTNILENNDNIQWGMSGSPLVVDNMVIVNPGAQRESAKGNAIIAYDRVTGKVLWHGGDTRAGYSSPMVATLDGVRQLVMFDGEICGGYDLANGNRLWSFKYKTDYDINVAQPLILSENRVLISAGYGHGSTMLNVTREADSWTISVLWESKQLRCKFNSPVEYEGYIYGLDEGILVCLDAESGQRKWRGERFGHGQILRQGDLIVIFAETGFVGLVEANPNAFKQLAHVKVFDETKNWNPFALARGKMYLRNHREMACLDLSAK